MGGLATYLYVEEAEPSAGRLTKDIDIAVRREDLEKIPQAAQQFGLRHRHVAGVDMLMQAEDPSARQVHLVFPAGPQLGPCRTIHGLRLTPLADLVRMKLTSFRAKDEAHIKDLDEAGLITAEVEEGLPAVLLERLARSRARE